jgi:DNA-binding MarR family transcriptional regulator
MNSAPGDEIGPADPGGGDEPSTGLAYTELWGRPGYLVRRLHQIHVGLFAEEFAGEDVTPVQFGMLSVLCSGTEMDQLTLSSAVGVDRTSGADVIKRLERRGLVQREPSVTDRRAKTIRITDKGREMVDATRPRMVRAQERLVAPLTGPERRQFIALIRKLIDANNDSSRAPLA